MAGHQIGIESRIGRSARLSGTLAFGSSVKIEGHAEGNLSGEEIVIAEGATVDAKVNAKRLVEGGRLRGEVSATQRIELLPTARVQCQLHTPSLIVHEGALFDGDCKMPQTARDSP